MCDPVDEVISALDLEVAKVEFDQALTAALDEVESSVDAIQAALTQARERRAAREPIPMVTPVSWDAASCPWDAASCPWDSPEAQQRRKELRESLVSHAPTEE